jgi:hypothetical protein
MMSNPHIDFLKALQKSFEEVIHERGRVAVSENAKKKYSEEEIAEIKFVTMVLAAFKPVLSRTIKQLEK